MVVRFLVTLIPVFKNVIVPMFFVYVSWLLFSFSLSLFGLENETRYGALLLFITALLPSFVYKYAWTGELKKLILRIKGEAAPMLTMLKLTEKQLGEKITLKHVFHAMNLKRKGGF